MLEVLSIISPIFVLIFLGYISVFFKILNESSISGLGRFVLYFALPALIIINVGKSDFSKILEPWFLTAYGVGSIITYTLVFIFFKKVFKDDNLSSGIKGMGASFSNSGFIGFPLLLQVFENPPIAAFAMILIFENLIMMPLTLTVLEYFNSSKDKNLLNTLSQIISKIATNPIIIAVFISIFIALMNITLPIFLDNSLKLLSSASAAAALFFIGGSLANNSIKGKYKDITLVSIFKLVLHPLMIALLVWILPPFNSKLQMAAILFASVPMMSIYPIIGAKFGYASFCSGTIMLTTVLSFFTITCLLLLF